MASTEIKTLNMGGNTYALNDTTARAALDGKVDKVSGKGLSTNDYTTTEKNKLATAVQSVTVNGTNYTPTNGIVDLGTISGGSSTGGATTPQELGIGYGTCSTAAGTATKVVAISGYTFKAGSLICVSFTNAITVASAKLNVNSTGAKAIYYKGSTLAANVIKAGDKAFFAADSNYFHLIAIDRTINDVSGLQSSVQTITNDAITRIKFNDETLTVDSNTVEMDTYFTGDDSYPASAYFTVSFSGNRKYEIRELDGATATSWGITLNATNNNENYVLLINAGRTDITAVTFRALQYNDTAVARTVVPDDVISIPAGKAVELSYIVPNTTGSITGIVTVSNTLTVS